jgi:CHAT domain-containing protein/Tfp pilus assembly protein PilF
MAGRTSLHSIVNIGIRKSLFLVLGALTVLACALIARGAAVNNGHSLFPATSLLAEQTGQEATALEPGKPIERELSGGQKHTYQLALAEGQYANVIVEQRGIDVAAQLYGVDGQLIANIDFESRNQGQEKIEVVAEAAGGYRLEVEPALKKAPAGRYEILLNEVRVATGDERALQGARKLERQSVQLCRANKYDVALPLIERALAVAEKVLGPDHVYVAQLVKWMGTAYFNKGDLANAKPLFERGLTILEKSLGTEHPQTANAMRELANVYLFRGEYPRADQLLSRALEIDEKMLGTEHPQVALCLMGLGSVDIRRGEVDKAEQHFRRALMIMEKTLGTEDPNFATALNNLGELYFKRRDYDAAEQFLQRTLAVYEKLLGPEHRNLAAVLGNLGIIARAKKDYSKAEGYYRRALSIVEKVEGAEHPDVALILNNLANLYRSESDYAKALEMHLRAVTILEKTAGPYQWVTVLTLGGTARAYAAMGDLANAIKYESRLDAAIETNIALNLAVGSERQKLAFLKTVSDYTDRTISLSARQAPNDPEASALATLVLLQRKGRVLDAMTDTLAALRQRSGVQDQALLDQLNEATAQLARLALNGPQKISPEDHQKKIKDLEEKKDKLQAEISGHSEGFRAQSQKVTLAAVQGAIPSNAALIEFAAYRPFDPKTESDSEAYRETHYVAYVLRGQGAPQGKDLGEAKAIDDAIDALRQALRDPQRSDVRDRARAVDEKVMQPVRSLLGDATQLLVSPDGALNLIPFEALIEEQGHYLIERYSISYLTSGRDLLRMQVARVSKSEPLVMADPLFGEPLIAQAAKEDALKAKQVALGRKNQSVTIAEDLSSVYFAPLAGTQQEARAIKSLFPEANVLTGAQATESALKRVNAPRILHIATHGFFLQDSANNAAQTANTRVSGTRAINGSANVENPLLRSGLALAGANLTKSSNDDNGILTALEASGLNLWGTKLVTLSACDTGLGEVKNGEGVYGLRRAFVLAGAETLVMSLWPVSDYVTREMMTGYYKGLKQGLGRGEALRQVKLAFLKRKDHQHPFYWASFIQAGEWANLDGKR